ncbi:MAG TPA: malto-oligosyltrehalose synthase [Candidatus Acidoferrales bacterium]|nr:malto-oligosyltrehalose synthase [Candidatus Acidoferrales bacterium]
MRIPSSTYRVQFNLNFRFADAEALVPYLHDLGISDLYASPRFKARKGSSHGYDVADPMRINSELGTEEEFDRLVARLHQYGMGLLLDIVPNHMSASSENPWWMDVLENGRQSRYAPFFDIDWEPQGVKISRLESNRVILPILAGPYAEMLWDQRIRLHLDDRGFFLQYEDHRLPLNPATYADVLVFCRKNVQGFDKQLGARFETLQAVAGALSESLGIDGVPADRSGGTVAQFKEGLWQLYQSDETIRRGFDEALRTFNGVKGQASSFDLLDSLLSRQAYRLAHWRLAFSELNYRRFFDINDLVGLRVEDPLVFSARHSSIIHLIQEGKVSGLRVDHIDGLLDPLEYLERLKAIPIPNGHENQDGLRIYTVVEKINCGGEKLPPDWPVLGTTGYDFLNALNALFIDSEGYRSMEESYQRFAGIKHSFADTWYLREKQVIEELFAPEMELLSYRLGCVAALDERGADIPVGELVRGLEEVTACLPVYRTYYRANGTLSEQDKAALQRALSDARRRASCSEVSDAAFDFLHSLFLAELRLETNEARETWLSFITRWQQFTGAVMAKGLEDTALFAHHGLISVNEVGNNPFHGQIGFGIDAFHQFNCAALAGHPHSMNATSTHDTKWSEDVRARINVLSEIPLEWAKRLRRWSRMNRRRKVLVDGRLVPTLNEEVILYQAMLGLWPLEPFKNVDRKALQSRLEEFFVKAAKEAKTETNWLSPNEAHESALRHFVASILAASSTDLFISDFLRLLREIARFGACNSCSQLVIKTMAPGVPDFYQGSELWNRCLIDPDNRQPVDFRSRIAVLENVKSQGANPPAKCIAELLKEWTGGHLKLFLTTRLLNFRRSHPDLFSTGSYQALSVKGDYRRSVFAFARHWEDKSLMVVVPRLLKSVPARTGSFPLGQVWGTTALEISETLPRLWTNVLTNEEIDLAELQDRGTLPVSHLFELLPLAVLASS